MRFWGTPKRTPIEAVKLTFKARLCSAHGNASPRTTTTSHKKGVSGRNEGNQAVFCANDGKGFCKIKSACFSFPFLWKSSYTNVPLEKADNRQWSFSHLYFVVRECMIYLIWIEKSNSQPVHVSSSLIKSRNEKIPNLFFYGYILLIFFIFPVAVVLIKFTITINLVTALSYDFKWLTRTIKKITRYVERKLSRT